MDRLTFSVSYILILAFLAKSREIIFTVHPESTKMVHGFLLMNALNINLLSLSDILGIILVCGLGADDDDLLFW